MENALEKSSSSLSEPWGKQTLGHLHTRPFSSQWYDNYNSDENIIAVCIMENEFVLSSASECVLGRTSLYYMVRACVTECWFVLVLALHLTSLQMYDENLLCRGCACKLRADASLCCLCRYVWTHHKTRSIGLKRGKCYEESLQKEVEPVEKRAVNI